MEYMRLNKVIVPTTAHHGGRSQEQELPNAELRASIGIRRRTIHMHLQTPTSVAQPVKGLLLNTLRAEYVEKDTLGPLYISTYYIDDSIDRPRSRRRHRQVHIRSICKPAGPSLQFAQSAPHH